MSENPYVPRESVDAVLEGEDEHREKMYFLLSQIIRGLDRIEQQLEILTGEELDPDEGGIL